MADLDEFAKLVWGKRAQGLPLPEMDLQREITAHELENIKLRAAFVQLISPNPGAEYQGVSKIYARTGWTILNYGAALSSSPGEKLFSHGNYVSNSDGILERVTSGVGTIIAQMVNTAAEMVQIAIDTLGWDAVHIVDGHVLMKWGVWKAGNDLQVPITGFSPSKEEEEKYRRIKARCFETLIIHPESGGPSPQHL